MTFGGESSESYFDEGLTASKKGDLARAIEFFEKAVQLDKTFLAAYHQLAKCYLRTGESRRAVDILQNVVSARPNQIPPRLDLGYALLEAGHTQEARRQFTHIIENDAANTRAHLGLAYVCFHEANWSGAVSEAKTALAQGGPNFSVLFILGRAAKLTGDLEISVQALEEAEGLIAKSIDLNPDQPEGYYLRGELSFVRESYAKALECYTAAELRVKSDHLYVAFAESFSRLDVLTKQALCYQRLGRLDKARDLGAEIVKTDPNHKLGQALRNL
ncbi:MAG: tetratricopeptide repeat protein [Candidatus Hydrogenedentes bacterium]|nr:tetratricopeptide repeat protein [Candidatus Hydrogenedentota bacterium]